MRSRVPSPAIDARSASRVSPYSDDLERVAKGATDLEPQPVTVADLAAGRVAPVSFVRVSGFAQANLVLELGKKGANGKLEYVRDRLLLWAPPLALLAWVSIRRGLTYRRGQRAPQRRPRRDRFTRLPQRNSVPGLTPGAQCGS